MKIEIEIDDVGIQNLTHQDIEQLLREVLTGPQDILTGGTANVKVTNIAVLSSEWMTIPKKSFHAFLKKQIDRTDAVGQFANRVIAKQIHPGSSLTKIQWRSDLIKKGVIVDLHNLLLVNVGQFDEVAWELARIGNAGFNDAWDEFLAS